MSFNVTRAAVSTLKPATNRTVYIELELDRNSWAIKCLYPLQISKLGFSFSDNRSFMQRIGEWHSSDALTCATSATYPTSVLSLKKFCISLNCNLNEP